METKTRKKKQIFIIIGVIALMGLIYLSFMSFQHVKQGSLILFKTDGVWICEEYHSQIMTSNKPPVGEITINSTKYRIDFLWNAFEKRLGDMSFTKDDQVMAKFKVKLSMPLNKRSFTLTFSGGGEYFEDDIIHMKFVRVK